MNPNFGIDANAEPIAFDATENSEEPLLALTRSWKEEDVKERIIFQKRRFLDKLQP